MPGGLSLAAPRLTLPAPGGAVTVTAERARLRAAEDGDGAAFVLPGGQAITVTAPGAAPVTLLLGGEGLTLAATGTAAAPDYILSSGSLTLALAPLEGDTAEAALALVDLVADLGGLDGDAATPLALDSRAETLTLTAGGAGAGSRTTLTLAQSDIAAQLGLTPPAADAGWAGTLAMAGGRLDLTARRVGRGMPAMETAASAERTEIDLATTAEAILYGGRTEHVTVEIAGGLLPVERADLAIDVADLALTVPFVAPDADPEGDPEGNRPHRARLGLTLDTVTAGDALWQMFDPDGALPRTAAHLDLAATADLTEIDAATRNSFAAAGGFDLPPVLPRSLEIETFSLSFAEAGIEADGRFTTETAAPGLPDLTRPIGALDVTMTGATTLLQRLVDGGLITAPAMLGAQMAIGMFATPGDGDTLSTRIETDAEGGLTVGGTRLR